jgi:protein-S-isoprenylcysteine O-methyltransferase Ste14
MALAIALISLEITATLVVSYAIFLSLSFVIGSQPSIGLPLPARLSGLIGIIPGGGVVADTLRYRRPKQMLISTSVTLRKLFGRKPIESTVGRDEQFSVVGPYRYVRNPMYLGIVLIAFGVGLVVSSILLLVWGLVLFCWFWFFLIPFEERELHALFGETYARYRRRVPKLLPYRARYRGPELRE